MVADVRMIASPAEEPNSGWNGEVPVFDMAGFTLKHLTCVVLSVLRVYMKYTQEAHPVRLRQIHIINCASYVDRIMAVVKPFMRKEVAKLVSEENKKLKKFANCYAIYSLCFPFSFISINQIQQHYMNLYQRIYFRLNMVVNAVK